MCALKRLDFFGINKLQDAISFSEIVVVSYRNGLLLADFIRGLDLSRDGTILSKCCAGRADLMKRLSERLSGCLCVWVVLLHS